MQKVVSTLKSMISLDKSDITIDNKEKESKSMENNQSKSKSSRASMNNSEFSELILDDISNIDQFDTNVPESNKSSQNQISIQSNIIKSENSLSDASIQQE